MKRKQNLPDGMTAKDVLDLIKYFEDQTEEEQMTLTSSNSLRSGGAATSTAWVFRKTHIIEYNRCRMAIGDAYLLH